MLTIAAYLFQYGPFFLALMMLAWGILVLGDRPFTKRIAFKLFPVLFLAVVFAQSTYVHMTITSPADQTIVHPGDTVILTVEMTPTVLSQLFPWVALTFYRCETCIEPPPGISTHVSLTGGSPYNFEVKIPATQAKGKFFVNAYTARTFDSSPAIRSPVIGLVVK